MIAPVRILCVDDNPHFLEIMCEYLQLQKEFEVVGTASERQSVLGQAVKLQPDVILLDLNLGEESAIPLISLIKKQVPNTKIIIVTIMDGGSYRNIALNAGADDFVHKAYLTKLLTPSITNMMKKTIDTNKNNEMHFTGLIENSKDLIYRYEFSPKRGFTYVNPAATAITGYTPEEHYADPDLGLKLVYPDDRPLLESASAGGDAENRPIVLRWRRKDGAIIWTEQFNVPIYDGSGAMIAIEGIARDITERKQAEEKSEETENLFEYVFDNSTVGKSITLPSGEVTANKAFCEMLGYTHDEMHKKTWKEISHPEDVALSERIFTSIFSGEVDSARFTKRYIRKDGFIVWGDVSTSVRRDKEGKPLYFMTVVNDITEQIQTRDKLRESERFIHATLNALTSHIAVLDETGTIIVVNRAWLDFAKVNDGDPQKTGVGINYLDVCDRSTDENSEFAREMAAGIRSVMKSEMDSFILEYPCDSPTEKRWFVAYVTRFQESGPLRIVIKHENITERKTTEQTLRESESTLQKAQKVAHMGSWKWHIPNNQLEWSDEMYRIFGINKESFTGNLTDVIASAVHPDDRIVVEQANLAVTHDKKPTPMEYRVVWPNGTVRNVWAEAGELTLDKEGQPLILTGIVQDITERKQAAEALRSAELRYRTLIENSSEQVSIISSNGELMYESPSASPLMGYQPGEFHNKNIFQLIHPDDLERIQKLFAYLLQEPNQQIRDRFRMKHREGRWVWVEGVAKNLVAEPIIGGIIFNYHDVTEQRKAEIQVQYQADLLKNVNDAIVATDENQLLTAWNAAAERTYGWKAEEVLGRSANEIVQAQWSQEEAQVIQRMLAETGHWRGEATQANRDGTRFPVESSITVLHSEGGKVAGYVGVSRDITERKQADEKIRRQLRRLSILRKIDEGIAGSCFVSEPVRQIRVKS